jgi:hypothetical protein
MALSFRVRDDLVDLGRDEDDSVIVGRSLVAEDAADKLPLTFRPILLETVVVMRGDKVAGTIKRYRARKGCIVRVPGVLTPSANPGECFFLTIAAAKARLIELDTPQRPRGTL